MASKEVIVYSTFSRQVDTILIRLITDNIYIIIMKAIINKLKQVV